MWEKDFRAVAAMRGIGWIILYHDVKAGRLFNVWVNEHDVGHLAGAVPLLVMDVFEHAYYLKHQNNRAAYVDAWWNICNWEEAERQYDSAVGR